MPAIKALRFRDGVWLCEIALRRRVEFAELIGPDFLRGFDETRATANDPKLSDGGGWRDGCAGEGGGAASVTAGAVRCSAWLGVANSQTKCNTLRMVGGR